MVYQYLLGFSLLLYKYKIIKKKLSKYLMNMEMELWFFMYEKKIQPKKWTIKLWKKMKERYTFSQSNMISIFANHILDVNYNCIR